MNSTEHTHTNGTSGPHKAASERNTKPDAWELPEALRDLIFTGDDLLCGDDDVVNFVIDGLVEPGDLVLVTGREKMGLKTYLALDLAIARVLGAEWFGFAAAKGSGRVLFISAETSARNIKRRLRALCQGRGIDPKEIVSHVCIITEPISMVPREERQRVGEQAALRARVAATKMPDEQRRQQMWNGANDIAIGEMKSLGRNLEALDAIESMPVGYWSLVVIDTLRATLEGDENNSNDARRYMQACRELARRAGCPVVVVHHTNKSGDGADARSARGSVEITAAPDVLVSIDTSGVHPTAHFLLRNHEAPLPRGYTLVTEPDGASRIEVRDAVTGKGDISDDDVLDVFKANPDTGLTLTSVRTLVAKARGGAENSKASPTTIKTKLAALVKRGLISTCSIGQHDGKTFEGWRLGSEGGVVAAKSVETTSSKGFQFPQSMGRRASR